MDISARAWLIVIGLLLIAAVLLDGYRRMRKNRSIGYNKSKDYDFSENFPSSELPNGGARVVQRSADDDEDEYESDEDFDDDSSIDDQDYREIEAQQAPMRETQTATASKAKTASASNAKTGNSKKAIGELFVINVLSKRDECFDGELLLDVLSNYGLRFGAMDIFHYHFSANGKPAFSVANAVEPGIFNIDDMSEYETPGLSFFMTLPGSESPLQSFDKMLECAKLVAKSLNADLKDSEHNLLTSQSSMHDRQRIEDYIRRSFRANPD